MASGFGCQKKGATAPDRVIPSTAQVQNSRKSNPSEILTEVSEALSVPGVPPPPLSKGTQRAARNEYLVSAEKALTLLKQLNETELGPRPVAPSLLPPSRSEEVVRIGSALSVALASAVDLNDSKRAVEILKTAERYIRFVAEESINGYLESGAVYDLISQGLQSLDGPRDSKTLQSLAEAWKSLEGNQEIANASLEAERKRLEDWTVGWSRAAKGLTVSEVVNSISENSGARTAGNDMLTKRISEFAKSKGNSLVFSPNLLAEESRIAVESAIKTLNPKSEISPTIDSDKHPIAAAYFARLRKWLIAAPKLVALRDEGLRLVAISAQLLAGPLPNSLQPFGKDALSPLSGMPFTYRLSKQGFDLLRPDVSSKGTTVK